MSTPEYLAARRIRLKAEGLCQICGKNPIKEGVFSCRSCRMKKNRQQTESRERLKRGEAVRKYVVKVSTAVAEKVRSAGAGFVPIAGTNSGKLIALAERLSALDKQRAALASNRAWWQCNPYPQDFRNLYRANVSIVNHEEKGK